MKTFIKHKTAVTVKSSSNKTYICHIFSRFIGIVQVQLVGKVENNYPGSEAWVEFVVFFFSTFSHTSSWL